MYASWYRQTYPDKVLAISQTSNEGLVSVDNSGTVRLWETGVANLAQSMTEWKVGSDDWYSITQIVLTYVLRIFFSFEITGTIYSISERSEQFLAIEFFF